MLTKLFKILILTNKIFPIEVERNETKIIL